MDQSKLSSILAEISGEDECLSCNLILFNKKYELNVVLNDQTLKKIIHEKWIIDENFEMRIVSFYFE